MDKHRDFDDILQTSDDSSNFEIFNTSELSGPTVHAPAAPVLQPDMTQFKDKMADLSITEKQTPPQLLLSDMP